MSQYQELLKHILVNGRFKENRTGVRRLSVTGGHVSFNLQEGIPIVTDKKIHPKKVFEELEMFLKGETNIGFLRSKGNSIWDEWAFKSNNPTPELINRPTVMVDVSKECKAEHPEVPFDQFIGGEYRAVAENDIGLMMDLAKLTKSGVPYIQGTISDHMLLSKTIIQLFKDRYPKLKSSEAERKGHETYVSMVMDTYSYLMGLDTEDWKLFRYFRSMGHLLMVALFMADGSKWNVDPAVRQYMQQFVTFGDNDLSLWDLLIKPTSGIRYTFTSIYDYEHGIDFIDPSRARWMSEREANIYGYQRPSGDVKIYKYTLGSGDERYFLTFDELTTFFPNYDQDRMEVVGLDVLEKGKAFRYMSTEGELGPVYGSQQRNWNDEGIDQIAMAVKNLSNDPGSSQEVVTSLNPSKYKEMALKPCHSIYQILNQPLTYDERLKLLAEKMDDSEQMSKMDIEEAMETLGIPEWRTDICMYQRSADAFLGVPYNWAYYGTMAMLLAEEISRKAKYNATFGELHVYYGDLHIYENHIEQCKELVAADEPAPYPTINTKGMTTENFLAEDVVVNDYNPGKLLSGVVAV